MPYLYLGVDQNNSSGVVSAATTMELADTVGLDGTVVTHDLYIFASGSSGGFGGVRLIGLDGSGATVCNGHLREQGRDQTWSDITTVTGDGNLTGEVTPVDPGTDPKQIFRVEQP